jgi:hypothetical protein
VGDVGSRDRPHHREYALSRNRDMVHRNRVASPASTTACSTFSTPCCRRACRFARSTTSS